MSVCLFRLDSHPLYTHNDSAQFNTLCQAHIFHSSLKVRDNQNVVIKFVLGFKVIMFEIKQ